MECLKGFTMALANVFFVWGRFHHDCMDANFLCCQTWSQIRRSISVSYNPCMWSFRRRSQVSGSHGHAIPSAIMPDTEIQLFVSVKTTEILQAWSSTDSPDETKIIPVKLSWSPPAASVISSVPYWQSWKRYVESKYWHPEALENHSREWSEVRITEKDIKYNQDRVW